MSLFAIGASYELFRNVTFRNLGSLGIFAISIGFLYQLPWICAKLTNSFSFTQNIYGTSEVANLGWADVLAYPVVDTLALILTLAYILKSLTRHNKYSRSILFLSMIPLLSLLSRLIVERQTPNGQPILLFLVLFAVSSMHSSSKQIIAAGAFFTLALASLSTAFAIFLPKESFVACPNKCTVIHELLSGSTSHYNQLGMMMGLGFSFVWLNFKGRKRLYLSTFVALVLYLSGSRAAYLSLACQILILIVLKGSKSSASNYRFMLGKLALLVTVFASLVLPFRIHNDNFATGRGYLWRLALKYFGESPYIGKGSKFWSDQFSLGNVGQAGTYSPHNQYLDIFVLGGIIAVLIFFGSSIYWIISPNRSSQRYIQPILMSVFALGVLECPLTLSLVMPTTWFMLLFISFFSANDNSESLHDYKQSNLEEIEPNDRKTRQFR